MLEERYAMQNTPHSNPDDKFVMNFSSFDADTLFNTPMGGVGNAMNMGGIKRSAHEAGLDRDALGLSSEDEGCGAGELMKKEPKHLSTTGLRDQLSLHHHHHHHVNHQSHQHQQTSLEHQPSNHGHHDTKQTVLPNGKKTKGRVKIKMEFIDNKLRRYTTFSKRKTGIMKKAYELSTLTGTQVMLLVASETGHVYTFATRKLQPMITSETGKALIQTCLNSPDPPVPANPQHEQRMSATGFEETELTYAVTEEEQKVRQMMYSNPMSAMHQQSQMQSPNHTSYSTLSLQGHHHPHYPPQPPTPHLATSTSANHPLSHSIPLSSQSDHLNILNHHSSHLPPSTPLPSQSPLPPQSPICTTSPSSPYPLLHHHPHHSIQTHNR